VAAPSYVQASTGATDATGAFTFTGVATGTIGDLVILQIFVDGAVAIGWGTLSASNINALDGTANTWTFVGTFAHAGICQQRIYLGRRTSASSAPTFVTTANTSGDDVYGRMYEFTNVSAGTALATVIENGAALDFLEGTGSTPISGATGTSEMVAQSFVSPGAVTLKELGLHLGKQSSPVDNTVIEIQTDSAGHPSGSVVGTVATRASSTFNASFAYEMFSCSIALSASTTYWIVVRRDGARDTTNFISWATASVAYPNGAGQVMASGTWGADTTDKSFVLGTGTDQGAYTNSGTSTSIRDAPVTTLGPDRLALNFVGINDDNAVAAFTGGTAGGTWAEAVAEYADSGGTDASIQLQIAWPASLASGIGSVTFIPTTGDGGANERAAQQFTTVGSLAVEGVTFLADAVGTPTGDLVVEIQTDSAGLPSGTVVGSSGSLAVSGITSTPRTYRVSLSASLSAATTYHVVWRRSVASDSVNYVRIYGPNVDTITGDSEFRDGGVWAFNSNSDLSFALHTAGEISSGATIDGGAATNVDGTDTWGVVGFALIGTTAPAAAIVLSQGFVNFNDPGVL
jgi:hypothetical protein